MTGKKKLDQIWESFSQVRVSDRGLTWNTDLLETLELENLLCITLHFVILVTQYFIFQCKRNRLSTLLKIEKNLVVRMQETTTK